MIKKLLVLVGLVACGDNDERVRIPSGDVAALQAAVANPDYAGREIQLAAGTYVLTDTLVLGPGQTLTGAQEYVDRDGDGVWDPTDAALDPADPSAVYVVRGATILDGSMRTTPNVVELQAGNTLQNLTVRGAGRDLESARPPEQQGSNIVYRDNAAGSDLVTVRDCMVEAGSHGIGVGGSSGEFAALIEGNVVRDMGEGVGISPTGPMGADGVTVTATVDHNRMTGDLPGASEPIEGIGLLSLDIGVQNSTTMLTSTGNIIDEQATMGVFIVAGFVFDPAGPANSHNTITWTSTDDRIYRNGRKANPMGSNGGVLMEGALDFATLATGGSSHNRVTANLTGTQFVLPGASSDEQNYGASGTRADVSAIGMQNAACMNPGTDNVVTANVTGATSDGATSFAAIDNIIPDGSNNTASVVINPPNTNVAPAIHLATISADCPMMP